MTNDANVNTKENKFAKQIAYLKAHQYNQYYSVGNTKKSKDIINFQKSQQKSQKIDYSKILESMAESTSSSSSEKKAAVSAKKIQNPSSFNTFFKNIKSLFTPTQNPDAQVTKAEKHDKKLLDYYF